MMLVRNLAFRIVAGRNRGLYVFVVFRERKKGLSL